MRNWWITFRLFLAYWLVRLLGLDAPVISAGVATVDTAGFDTLRRIHRRVRRRVAC